MQKEESRANQKERMRKYRSEHPEQVAKSKERRKKYRFEHREQVNRRAKMYRCIDLNSSGKKKCNIRAQSRYILFKTHANLPEYQIHHCFGYEDPSKFIYIPKLLHYRIHQLLRDKNIPADSDHWIAIRDLVNSCEEYTYIRC